MKHNTSTVIFNIIIILGLRYWLFYRCCLKS